MTTQTDAERQADFEKRVRMTERRIGRDGIWPSVALVDADIRTRMNNMRTWINSAQTELSNPQ